MTGIHALTAPPRRPAKRWFLLSAITIMLVLVAGAHWMSTQYRIGQHSRNILSRSYERRIVIADLMSRLKDAETGQRGYLITGDPAFLEPYRSGRAAIDDQRLRLERLLIDVPLQSARYERLAGIIDLRLDELDAVLVRLAAEGRLPAQRSFADDRGRQLMDRARTVAGAMMMEEDRMIAARAKRWDERGDGARRTIWLLVVAALVMTSAALALALSWRRSRYRLALQAQEAAARLRGVFDGTNDAIALLDPEGRIEEVNPAVTRLLGHDPATLIGRDIAMLVNVLPPGADLVARIGMDRGSIVEPLRIDRAAYHVDGHEVPVDVALGLMPMPTGLHVVAAIRDISERKAIDRMKDDFIATASHELRTPLTSVVGALGLLRTISGVTLSEPARRLVTVAEENSRRLIDLVNDLLDLEKMDSGGLALRSRPIDMVPILHRAARGSEGLAAGRGVTIAVEIAADALPMAGDDLRLARVVTNLLANAIRFSPDGGVVTLSAERRGGQAVMTVADRGPGVSPAFRNRLFTRFAQAGDARSAGGTGLGLAISQQIVRAHGGTIWFEPRPGGGACFRFSIMLRDVEARVLLCGGWPPEMVPEDRFAVERVGSSAAGMAALTTGTYAAAMIDLESGDPSGPDWLHAIFAVETRPAVPVIVRADGRLWIADGSARAAWRAIDGDGAADVAAAIRADRTADVSGPGDGAV